MKKFLVILAFLINFILPAKADVIPHYVDNINPNSIGVYQAPNSIKVYQEPNINSPLLLDVTWNCNSYNSADVSSSNLFAVYLQKRNLAFLTVLDENDGEDWVQIAYNKDGPQTGWIKKDEDFRFMTWRTFFNLYGRKYGLNYLKDAPEEAKVLYSNCADDAQQVGHIMYTQNVKLTAVKGNWILAVVMDVDRTQKIGWIKWRNISGQIYLFPSLKQ